MEAAVVIYTMLSAGIILLGIKIIWLIIGKIFSVIISIARVFSRKG